MFLSKFLFKPSSVNPSTNPNDMGGTVLDEGGFTQTTSATMLESLFGIPGRERRHLANLLNETLAVLAKPNSSSFHSRSLLSLGDAADLPKLLGEPGFNASPLTGGANQMGDILASFKIEWELPIALLLVSLVWWENFIDRDIKCGSYKLVNMKLLKENIIATRCKTNLISSLWKILATILFAYMFFPAIFNSAKVFKMPEDPMSNRFQYGGWGLSPNNFFNQVPPDQQMFAALPTPPPVIPVFKRSIEKKSSSAPKSIDFVESLAMNISEINKQMRLQAFTAPQIFIPSMSTAPNVINMNQPNDPSMPIRQITYRDQWLTYILPMIIQVLSSAVCYYTGRLACKLCMQRLGFALPLTLVTPVTLTMTLVICKWFPNAAVFQLDFVFWTCHEGYETGSFKWQVICGLGLWWLSQLWIGGHIWFGKGQRLALTDR